jgi:hypothetical protein
MDNLIFFAVIIAFSILDSILRKKKKGQKGADGLPVPEAQEWGPTEVEEYLPTYDEEPSYDDEHRVTGLEATQQHAAPTAPSPERGQAAAPSRELGIPKDIWEEIAALAGGRLPIEHAPEPPSSPPALVAPQPVDPREVERTQRRAPRAMPARRAERAVGRTGDHQVHGSHAGYGSDPSARAPSEQDGLDPLAQKLSQDAARARTFLKSQDRHSLRQAIILQELLGPPAAYRE